MVGRIFLILYCFQCIMCLETPGIFNKYYQIPHYYGSHFKERSSKENLVNDGPTLLSLSYTYSQDYDSNLWIADKVNHVIKYIDKVIGAIYIVAGVYGTSGYRDGNVVKSMFNKPTSIDIWRSSTYDQIRAKNTKPVLYTQEGASRYECKFATKDNYTDCGGVLITSTRVNNDKLTPNQKTAIPDDDTIDEKLLKYIDFTQASDLNGVTNSIGTTYVYVADTGNHCIRRISLSDSNVETVTGVCGTSGFLDGPLGTALLKSPELVSLDAFGYAFIFDTGNNYMRMLSPSGSLYTLFQGACNYAYNEYPPDIPFSLKLKTMMCFKNWIKTYGEPSGHIYNSATTEDYCFEFFLFCPREQHPLIRNDTETPVPDTVL